MLSSLNTGDIVVSQVTDGYLLLQATSPGEDPSMLFRGTGWSVQYAVARGAKLISRRGGNLWYSPDNLVTLEFLEGFQPDRDSWRTRLSPG